MTAQDVINKSRTLRENEAYVGLSDGGIGIATEGETGYQPLPVNAGRYNVAKKLADEANKIAFPDRNPIESYKIILSSL